jgi:hypothetical protein
VKGREPKLRLGVKLFLFAFDRVEARKLESGAGGSRISQEFPSRNFLQRMGDDPREVAYDICSDKEFASGKGDDIEILPNESTKNHDSAPIQKSVAAALSIHQRRLTNLRCAQVSPSM